jgi:hypothetical protein
MGELEPDDPFVKGDRRDRARAAGGDLIVGLVTGLIAQGPDVADALRIVRADAARRRIVVEGRAPLGNLRPGPGTLYGVLDAGLVRMPVLVLEIEGAIARVHCDVARAEVEQRRAHARLGVVIAVSGEPVGAASAWTARTLNVSAGGAFVDVSLETGTAHRATLALPGADLVVAAVVVRRDGAGSVLQFTGLSDSAGRALSVQLIRAAGHDD